MTYLYASLQGEGGSSVRRNIHSLVLEAFVSNKPDGAVARHINGNSFDNRLLNLTWGSQQENANDRSFHKVSRAKKALPVSITSFEKVGFEDTYDLEVEGPFHNFIGNGIVVHNSFDVQSMRYTGDRIVRAASRELNLEDVFYLRPVGSYTDRKGHKYTYTEETRSVDLQLCLNSAVRYAELVNSGFAEEHARGILPFDFRQNFVVSFNLRSALHFLDLRAKLDAQLEIRQFCELMLPHLHNWAPEIVTWYEENRLGKARLSP